MGGILANCELISLTTSHHKLSVDGGWRFFSRAAVNISRLNVSAA